MIVQRLSVLHSMCELAVNPAFAQASKQFDANRFYYTCIATQKSNQLIVWNAIFQNNSNFFCLTNFLFKTLRTLRTRIPEGSLSLVLLWFSLLPDRILFKTLAITDKQSFQLFLFLDHISSALQLALHPQNVNTISYSRQRKLFTEALTGSRVSMTCSNTKVTQRSHPVITLVVVTQQFLINVW